MVELVLAEINAKPGLTLLSIIISSRRIPSRLFVAGFVFLYIATFASALGSNEIGGLRLTTRGTVSFARFCPSSIDQPCGMATVIPFVAFVYVFLFPWRGVDEGF